MTNKEELEEEIDYLYMVYCRNFFPDAKDYYENIKNELIKLIDKYNKLYK